MATTTTRRNLLVTALVAATALLALPVQAADGPRKLALLVGIDQYGAKYTPGVPLDQQWSALDGAANDVQALQAELVRRGFSALVLTNGAATKAGILAAFRAQLVDMCVPGRGDVVLFHFSGHGQQIPDDNGAPDEADGYDEALIPFDNKGLKNTVHHLRDDELGLLVAEVAKCTPNVVISLDSCHSGTATRGARKKRGHAPVHAPAEQRGSEDDGTSGLFAKGAAEGAGYVLLSAVRADQEANEDADPVSQAPMGAYTLQLVQALRDAGPRTTYRQVMDRVGVQIVGRVASQNPQIEGDADKVLFSGQWQAAPRYYRTRPVDAEGLLPIEAGSLHGLAVGSELDVYAPGAREGQDQPLVRVRVTRVDLSLAQAQAVAGKLDLQALGNGGQAIEMLSQHAPGRLRVLVDKGAEPLDAAVAALRFVEIVPRGKKAKNWDLRLSGQNGRYRLDRADGHPAGIAKGPNQPLDPDVAADDPNAVPRLAQALESHYRRGRVAALHNPDAGSRLEVTLALTKVRAALETLPDGRKRPKILETLGKVGKDGNDRVKAGEILQLHAENKSVRACFFTILELSSDGSVAVIYPLPGMAGGDNKLEPGQKQAIAVPYRMTPPAGAQVFKLVATEEDVDFRGLEHRVRAGVTRGAGGSSLERMLTGVLDAKRSEPFGYAPEKWWGTDAARIEIVL